MSLYGSSKHSSGVVSSFGAKRFGEFDFGILLLFYIPIALYWIFDAWGRYIEDGFSFEELFGFACGLTIVIFVALSAFSRGLRFVVIGGLLSLFIFIIAVSGSYVELNDGTYYLTVLNVNPALALISLFSFFEVDIGELGLRGMQGVSAALPLLMFVFVYLLRRS